MRAARRRQAPQTLIIGSESGYRNIWRAAARPALARAGRVC